MKASYILLIALIASSSSYAKLGGSNGFSGEISLNTIYSSEKSQFNTDTDSSLVSLDQSAESEDSFLVAPLGSLAYTFGQSSQQQVYLGTARDDIAVGTLVMQLGYKYQLPSATIIDLAYLPTIKPGSTWQNPYSTTGPRTETDVSGNAYRLTLSNIADSRVSIDMAYADKTIENDALQGTELARDGETYFIKGQIGIPVSRTTMLSPAIAYITQHGKGDTNSYDGYRAELSLFQFFDRHKLALTTTYTKQDYQQANTTFNDQTRSEDKVTFFAAYEYLNFMGWDNWSLISFAGYSQTDANIDFYDESQTIVSLGVNYKF
ncbi:DUF2860 domain-containing protein [Vibrio lamellibrachiae]|uniref:DUF2860 domain-containing protein n=1 Tax=Vibrio lamellibrachiae TaxID=2910253 RepID=UPI003D131CFC